VDTALEGFQFSKGANAIFHFIYDELCDWYIEIAKPSLYQGPELDQDPAKAARRHVVQGVLATVLETTLRLLHPFAPYVTEEIWQKLPKPPQLPGSLMITVFPRSDASWVDAAAEAEMQLVQDVVGSCRMLRQTYNVPPTQRIEVEIRVSNEASRASLERYLDMVERAGKIRAKVAGGGGDELPGAAKAMIGADIEVVMPLGGLIDVTAEQARIKKDIAKAEKEIATLEKKLENPDFIAKAKEGVVDEQRARLADEQTRRQRLVDALATLGASA
ncbi:MAG: class I tRNA ligase family protein, partial [Deltaproteobacteria bacterium]|nr:class I tRNA ligase family protein [Deltaproteobacteria bacterium]